MASVTRVEEFKCRDGCMHAHLRVHVPSLDLAACTGDEGDEDPHLHVTLHSHDTDTGLVPAAHLDRPHDDDDLDDDTHATESAEWLALLAHVTAEDAPGRVTLVTPSGIELGAWLPVDQAAEAAHEYVETAETIFDLFFDEID